jgi:hypothetical protein
MSPSTTESGGFGLPLLGSGKLSPVKMEGGGFGLSLLGGGGSGSGVAAAAPQTGSELFVALYRKYLHHFMTQQPPSAAPLYPPLPSLATQRTAGGSADDSPALMFLRISEEFFLRQNPVRRERNLQVEC